MNERRIRTPAEEKELDYEHQRRGFAEYPHAMRHGKRKRRTRSARRMARVAAHRTLKLVERLSIDYDELHEAVVVAVGNKQRRKRFLRFRPANLRWWVERQKHLQFQRHGWGPSFSADDPETYGAVEQWLRGVLRTHGPYGRAAARRIRHWLSEQDAEGISFASFLRAKPIWKLLLLRWLSRQEPRNWNP